jgi:hypothetical protein
MATIRNISVTAPFGQAMERVKTVLFQPFHVGKWFVIGFCAWLAYLGQGGFHAGGNWGTGHGHGGGSLHTELEHMRDYVVSNLAWMIPLAIFVILVGLAIWLLVLWLSSRGLFMFLHCVALNTGEVVVPWRKFAREANSLFGFRVLLSLLGLVTIVPAVLGLIIVVLRMAFRETIAPGGIVAAAGLVIALMILSVVFWIIGRFLKDFVVPIQFLRRSACVPAWRELTMLLRADLAHFVLYLLFRIALAIGIGLAILIAVLVTCCCAGCLFALPYLGTVFLLPVFVLERSYSLYYLSQYGREYNVFPTTAEAI